MHNRNEAIYQNFLEDMVADMKELSLSHTKQVFRTIKSCWIRVSALKTYEQNLEAINHVDVLQELRLRISALPENLSSATP